jgi:uncharacterized protein
MHLEQRIGISAPVDRAWQFLTDLRAVSQCVPDIESIESVDGEVASGTIAVRLGPIALRLAGQVRMVERDADAHAATLEIDASDRRIGGGVKARTIFAVVADGTERSTLTVATDATLLGRLGQFGQPLIRRKSDELAQQFARNVAAALAAENEPAS